LSVLPASPLFFIFFKLSIMNKKITLNESDMPKKWYNVAADMPNKPLPPLHPGTKQPVGPEDLAPLFPMELIKQEVSGEKFIEIPDGVREKYLLYRPSPLVRATALEKALDTPARIYYKYEGGSPSGSHKTNTAFAQAFYNREEGVKKIVTETGAGQWGTALSFACQQFGLACDVYMVRVSYDQKPYRKVIMRTFGADVYASPSNRTKAGRDVLAAHPDSSGSLGIAISEAVEMAAGDQNTKYALGSVLNHDHRRRGLETTGVCRRFSGCGHRSAGWRLQFCRHFFPVPAPQTGRHQECALCGCGARILPQAHPWRIPL
jgi:tryptophan synthase beta chain